MQSIMVEVVSCRHQIAGVAQVGKEVLAHESIAHFGRLENSEVQPVIGPSHASVVVRQIIVGPAQDAKTYISLSV